MVPIHNIARVPKAIRSPDEGAHIELPAPTCLYPAPNTPVMHGTPRLARPLRGATKHAGPHWRGFALDPAAAAEVSIGQGGPIDTFNKGLVVRRRPSHIARRQIQIRHFSCTPTSPRKKTAGERPLAAATLTLEI